MFRELLRKIAAAGGQLPGGETIRNALVDKARAGIASEMGESYTKAVERCLKGDFELAADEQNEAALFTAFRKMVIDVIEDGMKL